MPCALAWQDGGQVIGLALGGRGCRPRRADRHRHRDTAKLTWSPIMATDWAATVSPTTLLIIDEAGMADTLSLDTAVQFAIGRGASVRLIGDDQQLAAIGAGGVLRDIEHTYGALHLTELHRFTDPAEAAASLLLREGKPEVLDFYLDHGRVHVGDIATTTHDAFAAWVSDRAAGLDAIMLAPARKLVAELNRKARDHLLGGHLPGREVRLADGNEASVGDVIITRRNDRRLRLTATDWVKNGDRWTVTGVGRGDLIVRHNSSHRTARLPADYVQASTGLGYATTIHGAQGVTADTMHGLATGQESRQQLYTMLTRGRVANHLYLQVPATATRTPSSDPRPSHLHQPRRCSKSSVVTAPAWSDTPLRELSDPAARLFGPFSATPTGSMSRPSSWLAPRLFRYSIAKPTPPRPRTHCEPSWPTLEHACSRLAADDPVNTHSSTPP